jgi:hypothetical protein
MKNILLASTALIVSAGFAAADTAMSASAKFTYGNYGTGTAAGTSYRAFNSEADVDITMTGGGDTVSYSAALELDEGGNAAAALTVSTSGVTVTYDANDISDITSTGADGEDDNEGDIKVSYAAGGLTASYAADINTATDLGYVATSAWVLSPMAQPPKYLLVIQWVISLLLQMQTTQALGMFQ